MILPRALLESQLPGQHRGRYFIDGRVFGTVVSLLELSLEIEPGVRALPFRESL